MKTRHIGIALAAVAVAGIWFGRLAWRAHHNLVTLHARNMPLAEVVSSLERQTWNKIRFDKSMSARITLNVKDAPLWRVLDWVAERAGARWQKTFAVGASDGAMKKLESVLDGAEKLDAAGWTNLAPRFSEREHPDLPDGGPEPTDGKQDQFTHTFTRSAGGAGLGGGRSAGAPTDTTTGAFMTTETFSSGGVIDRWSSERLVLESSLVPRLGSELPGEATAETAARVASSVHGRSRLYYALEKSPFGGGPTAGPPLSGPRKPGHEQAAFIDAGANITQMLRQQRLLELSRSPEEQVERARQHGVIRTRLETNQQSN
jgi:hypothetical protein